jgi:hypothetical protein
MLSIVWAIPGHRVACKAPGVTQAKPVPSQMGYRTDAYAGLTQLTTGTNTGAGLTAFPAFDILAFLCRHYTKKSSSSMSIRLSSVAGAVPY